jgi:hypothetical protein
MQLDGAPGDSSNFSNIERAMLIVSDCNLFAANERIAVLLVEGLGASRDFSLFGTIRQEIGDQPFIATLRHVIYGHVCCGTKSLYDGARATPCSDVLGTPAGGQHLLLSRWDPDFNFVTKFKSSNTANFIQPKSRFPTNKVIMRFCKLAEDLGGHGDSLGEKGR